MSSPRETINALSAAALILVVVDHGARWWMSGTLGWLRERSIDALTILVAPLFLFVIGFWLAHSYPRRAGEPWLVAARAYTGRGALIVVAGWLLNVLVFPRQPLLTGGLPQTIGLGVIAATVALLALRSRTGRIGLLTLALGAYAAMVLTAPALSGWAAKHPDAARTVFGDFPPWPWIGLVLVGLVLGSIEAGQHTAGGRRRYYATLALLGAAMTLGALEFLWAAETTAIPRFARDIIVGGSWIPGPPTAVWILGIVLVTVAVARGLVELRGGVREPPRVLGTPSAQLRGRPRASASPRARTAA